MMPNNEQHATNRDSTNPPAQQRVVEWSALYYSGGRELEDLVNEFEAILASHAKSQAPSNNFLKSSRELIAEIKKLDTEFHQYHGFYCNVIAAAITMCYKPSKKHILNFKALAEVDAALVGRTPRTQLQKLGGIILTIASIATIAVSCYLMYSAGITAALFGIFALPFLPKKETISENLSREAPAIGGILGLIGGVVGIDYGITLFRGSPTIPRAEILELVDDITVASQRKP